jgi:hypothetical protein
MSRAKIERKCHSCEDRLVGGATRCSCGEPTSEMSFDERRAFETQRWQEYRARVQSA